MSIFLLVIICIPIAFVIPMWFQTIALGIPRTELALDPVHWIGADGAFWLTLLLGLVSFVVGYTYILRMKPGTIAEDKPVEVEEPEEDEEEEELEAADVEEEVEEALEVEVEEPLKDEAEEIAAEDVVEEKETEEED